MGKTVYEQLLYRAARQLKSGELEPRVHGNGFIQVDVGRDVRINFYAAWIPRQKVSTHIHDHRFGFSSYCVAGALEHTIMEQQGGRRGEIYELYRPKASHGEDTKLHKVARGHVRLEPLVTYRQLKGAEYHLSPAVIHRVHCPHFAVTIMRKTEKLPNYIPRVYCRQGQRPDNAFDRHTFPRKQILAMIGRVLEAAKLEEAAE